MTMALNWFQKLKKKFNDLEAGSIPWSFALMVGRSFNLF